MLRILLIATYYFVRRIYKDAYKFVALLSATLLLVMLFLINFGKFESAEEVAGLVFLFFLILVAEIVTVIISAVQETHD